MYDELVKQCRDCIDCLCGECKYEHLQKPGNFVQCMNALLGEAADAIEELSKLADAIPHVCECCVGCELEKKNGGCDNAFVLSPKRAMQYLIKPRWIPVTEHLPEEMDRSCGGWSAEIRPSDDVLVWLSSENRQSVAWYSHTYNEWTTVDENTVYCFEEVTHWQPLSQPPKEE